MLNVEFLESGYLGEGIASAFLLESAGDWALVESCTKQSVPRLLKRMQEKGVAPDRVRYLILTHAHLDHAGGAGELLGHLPNAVVVLHPLAALHLNRPKTLVRSTKLVFGLKRFDEYFQEVLPLPMDRLLQAEDGSAVPFGDTRLELLHTPGHASHHICIWNAEIGAMFTGDAFGMCYAFMRGEAGEFPLPLSPPSDFDTKQSIASVRAILARNPRVLYPTHFGALLHPQSAGTFLLERLHEISGILKEVEDPDAQASLETLCWERLRELSLASLRRAGLDLSAGDIAIVERDLRINSAGIVHAHWNRTKAAARAKQLQTIE